MAGGLVTLTTAGDGGGSIRIPAAYNGLVGMKGTYGRIPRGHRAQIAPTPSSSVAWPLGAGRRPVLRLLCGL